MMKQVALVVIFGCAAVLAAPTAAPRPIPTITPAGDLKALVARAQKLVTEANKLIAEYKANAHSHLLDGVIREVHELEIFVQTLEMEAQLSPNSRTTHYLELQLKFHEDHIAEELTFVEAVYKNHKDLGNKTTNELVEFGEKLIKDAKAALTKKPPTAHERDIKYVEHEIELIQKMLDRIKAHPEGDHLALEQVLIRHELTLNKLIGKLQKA